MAPTFLPFVTPKHVVKSGHSFSLNRTVSSVVESGLSSFDLNLRRTDISIVFDARGSID